LGECAPPSRHKGQYGCYGSIDAIDAGRLLAAGGIEEACMMQWHIAIMLVGSALSGLAADKTMVKKEEGIVVIPSNHSVDQTVDRIKGILESKGITLFALVDHSGEAEKAGMKMPPTKLLIFGNPKGGTPVMLAAPTIAIDLPLKVLVWEDAAGKAWVSFNDPGYLQNRHHVPDALVKN